MSLNDQLLAALLLYGAPVLFGVILLAAIGIPLLPASLLLIVAGSFVEEGELNAWWVMGLAAVAAISGDNIGYMLGRWGGRPLVARLIRWTGGESRLRQAEAVATRRGGPGIFLTRWLVPPLGPTVNLASGIVAYPWPAFLFFEATGALIWVGLYVTLGRIFSDRIQDLNALLGNLAWVVVGLVAVLLLGWKFAHYFRGNHPQQDGGAVTSPADR